MTGRNAFLQRIRFFLLVLFALILTACLGSPNHERPAASRIEPAVQAKAPAAPEQMQEVWPTEPPDASKISVGPIDSNGLATVTGAAGAVPGDAALAVVNLSSRNVMTATAASNGAFTADLFAPPGSSLLVKYSPNPEIIQALWNDVQATPGDFAYMNPLPGTTIYVEGTPTGSGTPFHSAGFFGPGEGSDWAGWWLEGGVTETIPGGQWTVSGVFHGTSPAFTCSNPPGLTPMIHFNLISMFGPDGSARLGKTWFNAYLFTPTGLPIEHEADPESSALETAFITNLSCDGQNSVVGDINAILDVPPGIEDGTYLVEGYVDDGGMPLASGQPRVVVWYHFDPLAALPPVTVGAPDPPRIPWTLLANYPVNGNQGVQALEDGGRYQFFTRTILPPELAVVPMVDERSNEPIVYRLEPGANWLSATDRRFPLPPPIPFDLPGGTIQAEIFKPGGDSQVIGPAAIAQSSVRTPSLADGGLLHEGTGHPGDIYHLHTGEGPFAYSFDRYGLHTIALSGFVEDIYGNQYPIDSTYEVMVARTLDLDPAQLPTTPYKQGDSFAPGLHIFPPLPAAVEVRLIHLPNSDPAQIQEAIFGGQANRFGYFQPAAGTTFTFNSPGEFRVDIAAEYEAPDGTMWAGDLTWGGVVENSNPLIAAHGRRGMDYGELPLDNMPIWFRNQDLHPDKIGIENYYPYLSGDIHWGAEDADPAYKGDSIHSIITVEDLTGPAETIYDLMRLHFPRATNRYRNPPNEWDLTGLNARMDIGEAPLFITTSSGGDPTIYPDEIDMWGYTYNSSERPDVHVREIISEDGMGTAYWRFNDTYGMQFGEPANGDQPGDIKWEFGGVVFRVPGQALNQYAIYSSLWVLLPQGCDAFGCARVTPPFQDATGAGINGGPIMSLLGEDVDMLFLPKGVRPGDVLEVGDTVSFSGHVGPPMDSRVEVTITSPTGVIRSNIDHANKIGWFYDPTFDFVANETGRWTVQVFVEHDRPYIGNGVIPTSHNLGHVLGTAPLGEYEFYVVEPDSSWLMITEPEPDLITWPDTGLEPITIRGQAPARTTAVRYTIHDKGIVMGQGQIVPDSGGFFSLVYDAQALHSQFPMLSLVAHDAHREGLADEVAINFLAIGGPPMANTVTLIGEEIFIGRSASQVNLPLVFKP